MGHPLIGICVSKHRRFVHPFVKKRLQSYMGPSDVTWIMFDHDSVRLAECTVTGHRWLPQRRSFHPRKETFRIPDAVYMQCMAGPKRMNELVQATGNKVFNSHMFDKWEGWQLLAADSAIRPYLPDTQRLAGEADFESFLLRHRDLFLKPIDAANGHSSLGIVRAALQEDGSIQASYMRGLDMAFETYRSSGDFYSRFRANLNKRPYLLQQSIQTEQWMGGATDFRLHLIKNGSGRWEVSYFVFRIAPNPSHVIPLKTRILTMSQWKSMYPQGAERIDRLDKEAAEIGFGIGRTLDRTAHHFADISVDLGMESSGRLFVFEVNPLPTPLMNRLEPDRGDSLTMPLDYARYLVFHRGGQHN
ncbi:YheC/YheD family protein [Paenibacillus sp. GYB004]|uniref:YheC/YheD family protein n=1 Tax=Paenibacillus sp. GYB004 TaxID=2994393 RepID=UPI002F963172